MTEQHRPQSGLTIYQPTADRIARTLVNTGSYLINKSEFYTWKSGVRAPVYTDCRTLFRHAGGRTMVKKALGSAILSQFGTPDYIVGVADSGIVWSTLVADELATRTAFVRKLPKQHGTGGMLVGIEHKTDRPKGITAVIVDDLIASGGSLGNAIEALHTEAGITVLGVASIVNWNFMASRDLFRDLQIPAISLVSYPHLIDAALAEKLLTTDEASELSQFYQNPSGHKWSPDFHKSDSAHIEALHA